MESNTTHKVTDLAEGDKRSLEHLLGGQLEAAQQVFVVAFTPGVAPAEAVRAQAATRIERTLEKGAASAASASATDNAIDEAVDAAMQDIRRRPAS